MVGKVNWGRGHGVERDEKKPDFSRQIEAAATGTRGSSVLGTTRTVRAEETTKKALFRKREERTTKKATNKVTEKYKEAGDPDAAYEYGPDTETIGRSAGTKTKTGPLRGDETDESGLCKGGGEQ